MRIYTHAGSIVLLGGRHRGQHIQALEVDDLGERRNGMTFSGRSSSKEAVAEKHHRRRN